MFDKELPATPDATSYALIAWQATGTAADFYHTNVTNAAVATLTSFVEKSKSDQTVALGTWALHLWNDDMALYDRLINGTQGFSAGQGKLGGWNDSAFTTAFAALALSSTRYYFKPA
jgi:hypothetical protein